MMQGAPDFCGANIHTHFIQPVGDKAKNAVEAHPHDDTQNKDKGWDRQEFAFITKAPVEYL